MKKIKSFITLAAILLFMYGCNETMDVRSVKGSYSYKTSGQAEMGNLENGDKKIKLDNESGQLEIISLHDDDNVLLTFNQLGGETYSSKGTVNDDELEIEPFFRTYTVNTTVVVYDTIHTVVGGILDIDTITSHEKIISEVFDITVSGNGKIYDNSIIFDFKYEGKSENSDYTLKSEKVQMIAKRN